MRSARPPGARLHLSSRNAVAWGLVETGRTRYFWCQVFPANYIEVSDDGRGFVTLRFVGVVSDQQWAAHLDRCEEINRRGRHVALQDCREIGRMPAKQRQMLGKWLRDHAMLLRANEAACAIVMSTRWQRAFLQAVLWMGDFPMPMRTFSSMDEATAWLRTKLEDREPSFVSRTASRPNMVQSHHR